MRCRRCLELAHWRLEHLSFWCVPMGRLWQWLGVGGQRAANGIQAHCQIKNQLHFRILMENCTYFSAKLENGQTNWDDEWEEWELKSIECFDTKDTKTQWDKCYHFQQNECQNWYGNFLQFGFSWFAWGIVEFDFEVNFIVMQVTWGNGHFRISHWYVHRNVIALNISWKCIQNVRWWTSLFRSLYELNNFKWKIVQKLHTCTQKHNFFYNF